MKRRMRYAQYDLGEQQEGSTAEVRLRGSSANVMLLDPDNFYSYRVGQPFKYRGGYQRRSPVRLEIPHDGQWYVVVDLGGYGGRVQASVTVVDPSGESREEQTETVEDDESGEDAAAASEAPSK